ncbi:hypothetical protein KC324_g45 [Hortaea werneckii]|nr:hypothetical protein KC324_g45 [Hortaea werneckii]
MGALSVLMTCFAGIVLARGEFAGDSRECLGLLAPSAFGRFCRQSSFNDTKIKSSQIDRKFVIIQASFIRNLAMLSLRLNAPTTGPCLSL